MSAMRVEPASVLAWLGPAIGPAAFEVGADVHAAFTARDPARRRLLQPAAKANGTPTCTRSRAIA